MYWKAILLLVCWWNPVVIIFRKDGRGKCTCNEAAQKRSSHNTNESDNSFSSLIVEKFQGPFRQHYVTDGTSEEASMVFMFHQQHTQLIKYLNVAVPD